MVGVITGRGVLRHSFTIVKAWGLRRWARCVRAAMSRRRCTFLEVITDPGHGLANLRQPRVSP